MVSSCGKGAFRRQVGTGKASGSEPLVTGRNSIDGIESRVLLLPCDKSGGYLPTGQMVPGQKMARARFRLQCETWEILAPILSVVVGGREEGGPQTAESVRGRVPLRGRKSDHPVIVLKPGNSGGAKGMDCSGSLLGQPDLSGRS